MVITAAVYLSMLLTLLMPPIKLDETDFFSRFIVAGQVGGLMMGGRL